MDCAPAAGGGRGAASAERRRLQAQTSARNSIMRREPGRACRLAAISPAAVSALTLSAWPVRRSTATVLMTGMKSFATRLVSSALFTCSVAPTSGPLALPGT